LLVQIDTHAGVPLYRQVMDQVTRMIVSGELGEGQQLESVAGLAGRLKVNPMTISKAYGYLVEGGLVERRPGVGLFVLPLATDTRHEVKARLLEQTIGESAALAVQLGLDEAAAAELLIAEFRKLKQKQKRSEP
jgi:GntR family transcriptional regulator